MEREVTLMEMLEARENRVCRQKQLLDRHRAPLISFSMNIAGPVKSSPLIRRGFDEGCRLLDAGLAAKGMRVLSRETHAGYTGCEAMLSIAADAMDVKRVCTGIEDGTPLGRLFDMDVLRPDGTKIDREEAGGGERCCIVCGAPGRACASRRVHSVGQLQAATARILNEGLAQADKAEIAALATACLVEEVRTTPKPGLVDQANQGSHRDMNLQTFLDSAAALRTYWGECVETGMQTARERPEATFAALREAGKRAEQGMYAATGGVNTHKGVVYSLGVICGALGRLWRAEAPCRDLGRLLSECAEMTGASVEADFAAIAASGQGRTAGQRLYLSYGLRGIRGEVADGFPGVVSIALPAFQKAMAAGLSRNDAGVTALMHLIAGVTDTNMIARGGIQAAREAAAQARSVVDGDPRCLISGAKRLDRAFIARNLSPGGCADLLAITYFLYDWTHRPHPGTEDLAEK